MSAVNFPAVAAARAIDIAYVRFAAPHLIRLEEFLLEFGLLVAERDADAVYFRGLGPAPYVYVARRGAPAFEGVAFVLDSRPVLEAFAVKWSAPVEPLDGPGGGLKVRLTDPDGFSVEAVVRANEISAPPLSRGLPVNTAAEHPRRNIERRVPAGPAHVCRLGHAVLNVSDFRRSESWYKQRFGFITSDEIVADEDAHAVGAFLRCDLGTSATDHHTLFLLQSGAASFNHAAFEVRDFDDLMTGHDHLANRGREHLWGVGRHVLGSQIFDYWCDPWGHALEHWTDGDLLDVSWGSRLSLFSQLRAVQWGALAPHRNARP